MKHRDWMQGRIAFVLPGTLSIDYPIRFIYTDFDTLPDVPIRTVSDKFLMILA